MSEQSLDQLERRVDQLIEKLAEYAQHNAVLKSKLAQVTAQKQLLQDKNDELAEQVKKIIAEIKEDMV